MSRFELRVLLSSWGLIVDVDLSVNAADVEPTTGIPVAPKVWLIVAATANLSETELSHLQSGVRRVAPKFREALHADEDHLVFVLSHMWFPLTDSQDEALELAVTCWAVDELGLLDDPATVSFDRPANRYAIEFNEEMWTVEQ